MTEHARCPDCGAELPTGATAGLCPKCLLAGAMEHSDHAGGANSPFSPTTPQPGGFVPPSVESLAARFPQLEIVGLLGHGGMGAVYKARQTKLDRFVALKIIRPESADDPAFAERFTREARTLARLSHPHIVAVHDFGELSRDNHPSGSRTLYYFVMEYVDGANLRELMQSGGLRPEQALAIVPQICDALQYAHDEGVVHRDIKPENILVDRRGRVKIADFGLAKLAAQAPENFTLTATHQVMGTPRYMAPEQMAGSRAVDHRADIYSLGVVFYEMLTGELPLGSFEPPSSKTHVDPRLDEVVLRALAREPERRYQRASHVRTDVESIVRGETGAPLQASRDAQRARHSGESSEEVWKVAGLVARGWLYYMVLSFFLGALLIVGATILNWLGARYPGMMPTGLPLDMAPVKIFVIGAAIAVIGLAALVSVLRPAWKWARRRKYDSPRPGAGSAALSAELPPAGARSHEWSAAQAWSGPGPSTVLEREVAGIVDRLRGRPADSPGMTPVPIHTGGPRYSRKAIIGACWAALFFAALLALVPSFISVATVPETRTTAGRAEMRQELRQLEGTLRIEAASQEDHHGADASSEAAAEAIRTNPDQALFLFPLLLFGVPIALAPFGTTILGFVAISDIRHSRGRLVGLGLAFADAVLFPLLLLNAAIFALFFVPLLPSNVGWQGAAGAGLGGALLIGGSLTFLVVRRGWRAVSSPIEVHKAFAVGGGSQADVAPPPLRPSDFNLRNPTRQTAAPRATVDEPHSGTFGAASLAAPFADLDQRRVQMELRGPAVGLLVVALLSALFWCLMGFLLVWEAWGLQSGLFTADPVEVVGAFVGCIVLLLLLSAFVIGARHMWRLTGYEWCISASVLAIFPWSPAWLIGLPVGTWTFRLLRRQDVRDAFLAKAIEREQTSPRRPPRGGRDWVTLTREQVESDELPDNCIVCGAPTQERINKTFHYEPDWAGFLLFAGVIPGLIALGLTSKQMRVACPVCPADRGHWSRLAWISSAGWLLTPLLGGIGFAIGWAVLQYARANSLSTPNAHWIGLIIGSAVGTIAWLIPVIYMASTRVSTKRITDRDITLQGVAPAFAQAASHRRAQAGERQSFVSAGSGFSGP